jgi:hypothetical protein
MIAEIKKTEDEMKVPISSEHLFVKFLIMCELYHVIHELHIYILFQYVDDHNSTIDSKERVNDRRT